MLNSGSNGFSRLPVTHAQVDACTHVIMMVYIMFYHCSVMGTSKLCAFKKRTVTNHFYLNFLFLNKMQNESMCIGIRRAAPRERPGWSVDSDIKDIGNTRVFAC